MFRELRYGLMFFACAMQGLLVGGCVGAGIDGHVGPPYHWDAAPWFACFGAIMGSIFWLLYRYSPPLPS